MIFIELDLTHIKNNNIFKETKETLSFISNFIQNHFDNKMSFLIDRFEGNYAVCENLKTKEMVNIDISKLPNKTKENDIIALKDNCFYIDNEKTLLRKDYIKNLTKDLFENK